MDFEKIGFIKLFRTFREWEWYQDTNVKIVFLELLLTVNHKEKRWQGIKIEAGSIVTSYGNLAENCGISVMATRVALDKLEKTGEISKTTTNRFTKITLINWDKFQSYDSRVTYKQQSNNKQITNKQQTSNNQITTTKECKELKNDKNVKNNAGDTQMFSPSDHSKNEIEEAMKTFDIDI